MIRDIVTWELCRWNPDLVFLQSCVCVSNFTVSEPCYAFLRGVVSAVVSEPSFLWRGLNCLFFLFLVLGLERVKGEPYLFCLGVLGLFI